MAILDNNEHMNVGELGNNASPKILINIIQVNIKETHNKYYTISLCSFYLRINEMNYLLDL